MKKSSHSGTPPKGEREKTQMSDSDLKKISQSGLSEQESSNGKKSQNSDQSDKKRDPQSSEGSVSSNSSIPSMKLRDYTIINTLGSGTYSKVFLACKDNNESDLYSIKVIKFSKFNKRQKLNILEEIKVLSAISHPNIIKYKTSFMLKQAELLW